MAATLGLVFVVLVLVLEVVLVQVLVAKQNLQHVHEVLDDHMEHFGEAVEEDKEKFYKI